MRKSCYFQSRGHEDKKVSDFFNTFKILKLLLHVIPIITYNFKMMNLIKTMKLSAVALSLAVAFTACSSDDNTTAADRGTLKIAAKANYSNALNRAGDHVNLTEFLINFKEIELELQDGFYGSDDDIELKGPFEIDLLSGSLLPLVNVDIPNGIYEEIEFEFDKSDRPKSELFGKSMKMTGEINGTPFIFWHDFEDEIEVDFEDSGRNLVIDNNTTEVVINFNLNAVLSMVDFSKATDNDGDGVIMISPTDLDGNNALAKMIKQAIKAQIELMDDLD